MENNLQRFAPTKRPVPDAIWPEVSIGLMLVGYVILPSGLLTFLNLLLLLFSLIFWGFGKKSYNRTMLWIVASNLVFVLCGVVSGLGNPVYDYFKDVWYSMNYVVQIIVGFVFAISITDIRKGMLAIVLAATLIASMHLSFFIADPMLITKVAVEIRNVAGTGHYICSLALLILLYTRKNWKQKLLLPAWLGWLFTFVNVLSCVLSFSRTMLLVVMLGLFMTSLYMQKQRMLKSIILFTVTLSLGLSLQVFSDQFSSFDKNSFFGKILRSANELQIEDYADQKSINTNYRGFETARGIDTYVHGEYWQLLTGKGFGTMVDLGLFVQLSANPQDRMRYIPIFHNGFIFVLVKTGVIGMLAFVMSFLLPYLYAIRERKKHTDEPGIMYVQFIKASIAIILLTEWLISGPFSKADMASYLMMLGLMIGSLSKLNDIKK